MSSADLIQLEEQKMKSTTSTMVSSPANSAAALKAKAAAKVILNFKNSEGKGMSVDIGDEETRSSDLSLRAWLHHFDRDGNARISYPEFLDGMTRMGYEGNILELWNDIDEDGSGEISLEEIDADAFDLWHSFQRWCALTFESSK